MHNESLSGNDTLLYGCNGEIKSKIPRVESTIYGVFLFLQLILSGFGNTLVCLAITRFRDLRTLTNSLLFSLAVTDLLTPLVRVLFIAVSTFRQQWIFGCVWCKLSSVLGVFLCASSIMHLCAISIERFIVIKWPLRHRNWITKRRIAFVLLNIWITALLLSLFPYFGFVKTTFNAELLDCEILWTENPKLALILASFFFLFPFIVMSIAYRFIFKEVRKQTRRISAFEIPTRCVTDVLQGKSLGTKMRISRIIRQELKAVKVIVVVIGVFFVLWLPFFAVTSIRAYFPTSVSGFIQRFAFALAYLNSSCNWIIYSVMNRDLRRAFKKMLALQTRGRNSTRSTRNKINSETSESLSPKKRVALNSPPTEKLSPKLNAAQEIANTESKFVDLKYICKTDNI